MKASATLAPYFVADKICIKNCFDSDMAASVREGFRILKVIIGEGVRVNVVKDDTVMPLKLGSVPRSSDGAVEVATTTEWGIVRMSFRSWEDRGGSDFGVVLGASLSTSSGVSEEEYWRLWQLHVLKVLAPGFDCEHMLWRYLGFLAAFLLVSDDMYQK